MIFLKLHFYGMYWGQCTFGCTYFKASRALYGRMFAAPLVTDMIIQLASTSPGPIPLVDTGSLMCICCHTITGLLSPVLPQEWGNPGLIHSVLSADKASLKHCLIYASI